MTVIGWAQSILLAAESHNDRMDDARLNELAVHLAEVDEARQALRDKGYGVAGEPIGSQVAQVRGKVEGPNVWTWLLRLLGARCCGEFSPWVPRVGEFRRVPGSPVEKALAESNVVTFTKYWQERRCSRCGRVQQRALAFPSRFPAEVGPLEDDPGDDPGGDDLA